MMINFTWNMVLRPIFCQILKFLSFICSKHIYIYFLTLAIRVSLARFIDMIPLVSSKLHKDKQSSWLIWETCLFLQMLQYVSWSWNEFDNVLSLLLSFDLFDKARQASLQYSNVKDDSGIVYFLPGNWCYEFYKLNPNLNPSPQL